MRVAFADLTGCDISCRIENDGWFPEQEFRLARDPEGLITINLTGQNRAAVTGAMKLEVFFPCDRCCREVRLALTSEFAYHCIVGEEAADARQETECREDDINRHYLKEPVVDLGEMLQEQLFLAMPSRVLCEDSCRGLCAHCGVDLNNTQCQCGDNRAFSPFSVLAQLKRR